MRLGISVFLASVVIVSLAGVSTTSVPPRPDTDAKTRQDPFSTTDNVKPNDELLSDVIETSSVKSKDDNDENKMKGKGEKGSPEGKGDKNSSGEGRKSIGGSSSSKRGKGGQPVDKGGKVGSSRSQEGKHESSAGKDDKSGSLRGKRGDSGSPEDKSDSEVKKMSRGGSSGGNRGKVGSSKEENGKQLGPGDLYQTLKTTIVIAATEISTVYLNGVPIGGTKDWSNFSTLRVYTGVGDVIGVVAKNSKGWHGIIADIKVGNAGRFMTGKSGFKTMVADEAGGDRDYWMMPGYKICSWKTPVPVQRPKDDRFSRDFPYRKGIKYVWAPSAPTYGSVYLRFVVGGEICLPLPSQSPSTLIPGQDDCTCKEVLGINTGDCFEFIQTKYYDTFNKKQSCKRRACLATYECVETGGTHRCMRRFATREVRKWGAPFSGKCVQVPIDPAKSFYVPYAEL